MRAAVVCVIAFTLASIGTANASITGAAEARAAIADAHANRADAQTKLDQAKVRASLAVARLKRAESTARAKRVDAETKLAVATAAKRADAEAKLALVRAQLDPDGGLLPDDPAKLEHFHAAANLRDAHHKLYEAGSRIKLAEARHQVFEADAHERAHRIGSAARAIQLANQLADVAADPDGSNRYRDPPWPPFNDAQAEAVDLRRITLARMTALLRRCSWLSLGVRVQPADLKDLFIMDNARRIPLFEWQGTTPIDGGEHEIVVRLKGRVVWRESFRIANENGNASVLVDLLPKPVELAR